MTGKRRGARRSVAVLAVMIAAAGGSATALAAPTGDIGAQIVGGRDAAFPWAVSFQTITPDGTSQHRCGGTLVTPRWVISAAHCAPVLNVQARVGSLNWKTGGELVPVARVITHPGFQPTGDFGHDIALVELARDVHAPVFGLAHLGPVGSLGLGAGWGMTCDVDITDPACRASLPDNLQELDLRLADEQECLLTREDGLQLYDPETMACIVPADGGLSGHCFGDSGGPFLRHDDGEWRLAGILVADMGSTVPHEHLCSTDPGGRLNHGAITDIGPFIPWINRTIGRNSEE